MDVADLVQCRLQARVKSTMQWKQFNWLHSSRINILDKNPSAKTSAGNVGDGAIGAKTAHPPTKLETTEEEET